MVRLIYQILSSFFPVSYTIILHKMQLAITVFEINPFKTINLIHKVPTEYFKVSTAKISARFDDWLLSYGHFADFVLYIKS